MSIANVESAASRATPPDESARIGGWLVAGGTGHVSRMNSASTLAATVDWSPDTVAAIAGWYEERGLPPRFRLTDREAGRAARAGLIPDPGDVIVMTGPTQPENPDRSMCPAPSIETWLAMLARGSGSSPGRVEELGRSLRRLTLPLRLLDLDGVACGAAVVDGPLIGLFDIATHPTHRQRGLAREVSRHLLAWGHERGARSAYLQVVADNAAAVSLYAQLGFGESHRYRYWRLRT